MTNRGKRSGKKGKKTPGSQNWPRGWMPAFLEALEDEGGHVPAAAQIAGVGERTTYEWRDKDEKFADAWEVARQRGRRKMIDELKSNTLTRATRGWLEPAGWYKGKAGGVVRKYSDQLAMFMLRTVEPGTYNLAPGDQTGGDAGTTPEQRAQQIREFLDAMDASVPEDEPDGPGDAEG